MMESKGDFTQKGLDFQGPPPPTKIPIPINIRTGSMGRGGLSYASIRSLHDQTIHVADLDMTWGDALKKEFGVVLDLQRYFIRHNTFKPVSPLHGLDAPISELLSEFKREPKGGGAWRVTIIDLEQKNALLSNKQRSEAATRRILENGGKRPKRPSERRKKLKVEQQQPQASSSSSSSSSHCEVQRHFQRRGRELDDHHDPDEAREDTMFRPAIHFRRRAQMESEYYQDDDDDDDQVCKKEYNPNEEFDEEEELQYVFLTRIRKDLSADKLVKKAQATLRKSQSSCPYDLSLRSFRC